MVKEAEKDDPFFSGMMQGLCYGALAGTLLFGPFFWAAFNRSATLSIDEVNADLARHNLLTREGYCDEAKKALEKLNAYFTSISKNSKSPPFTLDMNRCEENLKATDTALIQPQP